jgi:hypothetical protein
VRLSKYDRISLLPAENVLGRLSRLREAKTIAFGQSAIDIRLYSSYKQNDKRHFCCSFLLRYRFSITAQPEAHAAGHLQGNKAACEVFTKSLGLKTGATQK